MTVVPLLSKLISISSVSGNEASITAFIHEWFVKRNFTDVSYQGKNVLVRIEGKNRSKCLILNGHVDTVEAGSLKDWTTQPLRATEKNGRLYGLGASDMKAGIAANMALADMYRSIAPACDVWCVFVVGEEVDGRGSQDFVAWLKKQKKLSEYKHVECIIAEPTNASAISIGHRGNQFVQIHCKGKGGHASMPEKLGVTAIDSAKKVIDKIAAVQADWIKRYSHPLLGPPTIGITGVWGGDMQAPNKVTADCTIQLDIRTTPEMHEKLETILKGAFKHAKGVTIHMQESGPPGWCDESSELRRMNQHLPQTVFSGSTDMCFFTNAGIPAIVFGPGQRDTMHSPNESVEIHAIDTYMKSVQKMVENYGNA